MKTRILNPMINLSNLNKNGVKIYGPTATKIAKGLDPETQVLIAKLEAKGFDAESIKAQIRVVLTSEDVANLILAFPRVDEKGIVIDGITNSVTVKNIHNYTHDDHCKTYVNTNEKSGESALHTKNYLATDILDLCRFAAGDTTVIE